MLKPSQWVIRIQFCAHVTIIRKDTYVYHNIRIDVIIQKYLVLSPAMAMDTTDNAVRSLGAWTRTYLSVKEAYQAPWPTASRSSWVGRRSFRSESSK